MGVISQQLAKNSTAETAMPAVVTPMVSRSKAQRFKDIAALSKEMDKKHDTTSSFVRLGSKVGLRLPCISTGLPTLDEYVLQCGGVPKGRILEFFGPSSAGKCLPADTYVSGPLGLLTIKEVFERCGLVPSCTTRTTPYAFSLSTESGETESTTAFTTNGRRTTFAIETFTGQEIRATENHPHRVLNTRGQLVWKRTGEISVGDYLVRPRKLSPGTAMTDDAIAYGLGVLVADASFEETRIQVTNDDPQIKEFIETFMPFVIGHGFRKYPNNDNGSYGYQFSNKVAVSKFYENYGYGRGLAKDKHAGAFVRTLDARGMALFLRGYFDCECSIDPPKSAIEVCSASKKLLTEVKLLLNVFGIVSLIRPKVVKAYPENDYFRLTISGEDARTFRDVIGTSSVMRQKALDTIATGNGSTNFDSVPNCGQLIQDLYDASETSRTHNDLVYDCMGDSPKSNVTYKKLKEILELKWAASPALDRLKEIQRSNYVYDRVENITEHAPEPTFDFSLPSHSFIANGFCTHNTTLALHVIAECQRAGGVAAFVDAEQALDPTYAADILSVNVDDLIVNQPNSGEEALQNVSALVDSRAVDIIVVDSVSALVPQAELAGDIGSQFMGLQARMMSQAMRVLVGKAASAGTSIIFINQIREKIGVMFGSNETVSGGRALGFASSVRLDIRRISKALMDGDRLIGHTLKIKAVKNKCGVPFRETLVSLMYDSGLDKTGDLIDFSIKHGVLEKAGAWYRFDGTNVGNGLDKTKEILKSDTVLLAKVQAALTAALAAENTKADAKD